MGVEDAAIRSTWRARDLVEIELTFGREAAQLAMQVTRQQVRVLSDGLRVLLPEVNEGHLIQRN